MLTVFNSLRRGATSAPTTRVTTRNVLLAGRVTLPLRALPFVTMRIQPFGTASQVTQDFRRTMARQLTEDKTIKLDDRSRYGQKFQVPDYEVEPESLLLNVRHKEPARELGKDQHPIEHMAKANRIQNEIFGKLAPNELILTNLPKVEVAELASPASIRDFLVKSVHKDLQVKDVQFIGSLTSVNLRPRTAYVKVELGSKRQAQMVKSNLRKTWLHDCLIKIKTSDDAKSEAFDNRTVILNGLPRHLRAESIMDYYGEGEGAIVGVEMPMQNTKLSELRKKVAELEDHPIGMEREIQRRRALIAVEDGLSAEERTLNRSSHTQSNELMKESRKLDQERTNGILQLITRLQSEGKSVVQQRIALLDIKEQSTFSIGAQDEGQATSVQRLREAIDTNKESVAHSLSYLQQNSEMIQNKVHADPMSDLLRLGKEELAATYDRLIDALGDRERAIEARLRKSIEHYGLTERILQQGKDYSKELEDVQNVGEAAKLGKPEDYISVGQQVHNVLAAKNISAEEKVYKLLNQTLNPFETSKNFTDSQLIDTSSPGVDRAKLANVADPRIPASLQHLFYKGSEFMPENKKFVDKIIADARTEFNTPFDELYHAQKQVIQDVIEAEQALEKKLASLPDPAAAFRLDISKVTPEERSKVQDVLENFQSPFTVGQRRQREAMLSEKLKEVTAGSSPGSYKFDFSEGADLLNQIDRGMISAKQAKQMKMLLNEGSEENLGYAFLTFSHSDEARLFLMNHQLAFYEMEEIDIMLKSHLDHSSMDMQYFLASARNAAKTVDEIQAVRDARQRLRDFESNLDSQLPSRKRLQKFRRFTQSLLEEHKYLNKTKQEYGEVRSKLEQDRLDRKVKEFEAENPGVDLTAIYDNDKTEAARRALHKKAYASYKAFHFLKNGVKRGDELLTAQRGEEELSSAKKRLRDNDRYNFPELDRTVKSVLSGDIDMPRLNDAGEPINKPGRRLNGYTQSEFLEAHFGKDAARRLQTETLEDPLYIAQKSFKERYPLNGFLKTPALLEKDEQLRKMGKQFDPAKGKEMLPVDNDLAEFHRHRSDANNVFDIMQQYPNKNIEIEDGPEPADLAEEFSQVMKQHRERQSKRSATAPQGTEYVDPDYLNRELDQLKYAMETGKYGKRAKKDWFEALQDPREDREVVERKLAESEGYSMVQKLNYLGDDTLVWDPNGTDSSSAPRKQVASEKEAVDELEDAKFEPSGDTQENQSSVRKNRNKRQGANPDRQQKNSTDNQAAAGGDDSNIRDFVRELALLKQGKGSDPIVVGRDGAISGRDVTSLSEKDYIMGRQMAKLSPEERKKAQQQRDSDRVALLENLISLSKKNDGLDADSLRELASEGDNQQVRMLTPNERKSQVQAEKTYISKYHKEQGHDPNFIKDEAIIMKFGSEKEKLDLSIEQRRRASVNKSLEREAEGKFSGSWFQKYQTGLDKAQDADDFSATRKSGRMLDDFINEREGVQMDEENDDDVYERYREMANRTNNNQQQKSKSSDASASFTANIDDLRPEMPGFEDYFKSEADGVHPFDRIAASFDQSEVNTPEEHQAEMAREEEMYKRQLLGKLMGQKLSAREYELISGMQRDEQLRFERVLDVNNEEFLENRQRARLMNELAEQERRRKVYSGEWTESESHARIQQKLVEDQEELETGEDFNRFMRDYRKAMTKLKVSVNLDMDQEKEYHFDEGVGVSLDQHIIDLKERYPEASIQTRRDHDGFAIVKLSFRPEFKYDLDQILAMDSDELKQHEAETLETILSTSKSSDPSKIGPVEMTRMIAALRGQATTPSGDMNISDEQMLAMRKLAKDRAQGRYRDDIDGFKDAMQGLLAEIETNSPSGAVGESSNTLESMSMTGSDIFDELYHDRERFRTEIAYQLRAKINKHMLGKKRVTSDFVKPRFNETSLLNNVGRQINDMEEQVGSADAEQEDFDRDAFDRLKRELSEHKKLKEDMLSGTLPRFKPFLRL